MNYQVVVVSALRASLAPVPASIDFDEGAKKLAQEVRKAMAEGWEPLGGVAVGQNEKSQTPYLLQAMVRR